MKERGGAVEAHWAHNPGVGGSKPLPATSFLKTFFSLHQNLTSVSYKLSADLLEILA